MNASAIRLLKIPAAAALALCASDALAARTPWAKHTVHTGFPTNTAVAADFTGDGKVDVVASSGGKVRLLVAPDWREVAIYTFPSDRLSCIHSAILDVDGDGDPDYLGAHSKGPVFWLERPDLPESGGWNHRVVDSDFNGVHCLLVGDVDLDGSEDLIVNNFEPTGPHANSILWLARPRNPRAPGAVWKAHPFAKSDAAGGNHYMGLGDIDADGLPDITCGAKGEPFLNGNWFAWWKNPGSGSPEPWKKFSVAENQTGATNIIPVDLTGDGKTDLLASRGHGSGVLWFEGSGAAWRAREIDPALEGPHCLAAADLDEDGDIDAATCGKDSRLVMWYENNGGGNFTHHLIAGDQAAYDIRAGDMDGDGDRDLLIAGQSSANVVWFENPLR